MSITPSRRPRRRRTVPKRPASASAQGLLARVAEIYQASFEGDRVGRDHLLGLGIARAETFEAFGVGYAPGRLVQTLPPEGDLLERLQDVGVLDARGREVFEGCLTVPLLDPVSGAPIGLFGHRIGPADETEDRFLPAEPRGVCNPRAARLGESVIVVGGVLDALILFDQGFRSAVPALGAHGLGPEHEELFAAHGVREAYLVLPPTPEEERRREWLRGHLARLGIEPFEVDLGEPDLTTFFRRHAPEALERLLQRAKPTCLERSTAVSKREVWGHEPVEGGFRVSIGERRYVVKAVARMATQLRVVLEAAKVSSLDVEGCPPPGEAELLSLDCYSDRTRGLKAKHLARFFGEEEALIREDLRRITLFSEQYDAEARTRVEASGVPEMSAEEREEALAYLRSPDLVHRVVVDAQLMGLCGEADNVRIGYLVVVSRLLDRPLALVFRSRSGAGKSTLLSLLLDLAPPEAVKRFTAVTAQALYYQRDSLKRTILALEEAEGMGRASYSIKALQSSGVLEILSAAKDPSSGQMESRTVKVEGPVSLMMTTTRLSTDFEGELASRCVFLSVDESPQATEDILAQQRAECLPGAIALRRRRERIRRLHHNVQRLLEPLAVVNRYAEQLRFPARRLGARRDQPKYLGLIDAIALLHQKQRTIHEVEIEGERLRVIEATREDIGLANRLATSLFERNDELSDSSRSLLREVRDLARVEAEARGIAPEDLEVTRRAIRQHTGWEDHQIKRSLSELRDLEHLRLVQGGRGHTARYRLVDPHDSSDAEPRLRGLVPARDLVEPAQSLREALGLKPEADRRLDNPKASLEEGGIPDSPAVGGDPASS